MCQKKRLKDRKKDLQSDLPPPVPSSWCLPWQSGLVDFNIYQGNATSSLAFLGAQGKVGGGAAVTHLHPNPRGPMPIPIPH